MCRLTEDGQRILVHVIIEGASYVVEEGVALFTDVNSNYDSEVFAALEAEVSTPGWEPPARIKVQGEYVMSYIRKGPSGDLLVIEEVCF